ncbi:hypothetical protein MMMB2_5237 [Mycobacterium marinum MB2]|nr:hypothetical protein MMMB2_5237 [Mycobacterium marinum MB2]
MGPGPAPRCIRAELISGGNSTKLIGNAYSPLLSGWRAVS